MADILELLGRFLKRQSISMSDNLDTEFILSLKTVSSQKLCEIVVAHRYLGNCEEKAVLCMKELAMRRGNGDSFEFEKYIEEMYNKLPKLNSVDIKSVVNGPSLMGFLNNFKVRV